MSVEAEERWLLEVIGHMCEAHERAVKPYFERLAQIHALRAPPPLFMTTVEARERGLSLPPTDPKS